MATFFPSIKVKVREETFTTTFTFDELKYHDTINLYKYVCQHITSKKLSYNDTLYLVIFLYIHFHVTLKSPGKTNFFIYGLKYVNLSSIRLSYLRISYKMISVNIMSSYPFPFLHDYLMSECSKLFKFGNNDHIRNVLRKVKQINTQ